ncbi:MAG TPA: hypothetical protein VHC21_04135 [Candidatus Saccharimonadales bacterium]|nr:hypothetical protein [Candidatus Saccharimonadales bacterium]HVX57357.1 hypothetical protein [Candidatus Saccharimonadales bacterium]
MFNRLRSKEAATISAILALGLGVTACGGSNAATAGESDGGAAAAASEYPGINNVQQKGSAVTYEEGGNGEGAGDIYYTAYCVGDLLMIQGVGVNNGGGTSLIARREPQTCADGTVTVAQLSNIR